MTRAEHGWDEYPPIPMTGQAAMVTPADDEPEHVARLYIPDPESRSGWAAHWVKRRPSGDGERRRVGFR